MNINLDTQQDAKFLIRDQAEVIYHFFEVLHTRIPLEQQHLNRIVPGFYGIIKDLKDENAKLQAKIEELEDQIEQDRINAIEASEYD